MRIELRQVVAMLQGRWAWVLIGVGALLRLQGYFDGRTFWMDEGSLRANIVDGPTFALVGPLRSTQAAPPLFLLAERVICRLFGDSEISLRLIPLAGGIASLFLMRVVAFRLLPARGALMALAIFAVSDEQIYFCSELKPYNTDVTAALGLLLATLYLRERELTAGRLAWFAALGGVLVWFSFAVPFVLASSGLLLMGGAARSRRWARLAGLVAAAVAWSASFVGAWLAARTQLAGDPAMWSFWDFAFPPPLSVDPTWALRRVLFLFVNPLDWHGPLDPRLSAIPAVVCAGIGWAWLARRSYGLAFWLVEPLVFQLVASALRLYPFHGRLALYIAPSLMLLVAAGAEDLWDRFGRRVGMALVVLLLAQPVSLDLYHLTYAPRVRAFHPLGDRRPSSLLPDLFRLSREPDRR
jgi:hypothetical protein